MMLSALIACAPPIEPITITVDVTTDAHNAAIALDVVVGDGTLEVARAAYGGVPLTLELPPPEADDAEVYVGVVDAAGHWRGVASEWLHGCTSGCSVEYSTSPEAYRYGWNQMMELWQQADVPTGDPPPGGFAFTVRAMSHGDEAVAVAVPDAPLVAGLRRAVVVVSDDLSIHALAEAPVDATTVTLGPGAPASEWVEERYVMGEETGWNVRQALARIVAYDDVDASGGWSDGDGVIGEACLDRMPVTAVWVAPTDDPFALFRFNHWMGLDTGWTVAQRASGQGPLDDAQQTRLHWCNWTG